MHQIIASDLLNWSIRLVAFLFGAIWGSFFNVAIFRWPRGLSVVTPASRCPACDEPIPWYLNLPIFGFFLLRGRAACCGAKISRRYVLVEIIGALLSVAVVERYLINASPSTRLTDAVVLSLLYFAFVGGLVIITFIDMEFMEIPDEVSLPLAALGLVTASFRANPGAEAAALGAGGSYLIVQLLFVWAYERLTGRRGMGEGDAKLLMMIGAFLGWQGALFSLMAGAFQGIVVVAVGLILGRSVTADELRDNGETGPGEKRYNASAEQSESKYPDVGSRENAGEPQPRYIGHLKIPFGPFLALSALEFLFFGQWLLDCYFGLFY
ncbi:MAG: prepilin peptidase [Deltaproteobacteria bacterium]|nr:prepilin peptidase [Deltaproteobacteria bacterium]